MGFRFAYTSFGQKPHGKEIFVFCLAKIELLQRLGAKVFL